MTRLRTTSLLAMAIAAFVWWTPEADAHRRYNPTVNYPTGCADCHGAFTDGSSPKGTVFPEADKHQMHRSSSYMGTACDLCHTASDNRNPYIGSSTGTATNAGVGCTGCHETYGLRLRHQSNGVDCVSCHAGDPAPPPESTKPPYYGTANTKANAPCNPTAQSNLNENWSSGDILGLDNDGDGLYDMADGDCATSACGNGLLESGEQCDDGNTAAGDCCSSTCTFEASGSLCSDGLYCNAGESCNGSGLCAGGSPRNCSDGIACTIDSCTEATDTCANMPNNAACDDGLYCNGVETCNATLGCQAGILVNCADANICTDDACNETTNACDHVFDPTNDPSCQAGPELDCFDGVDNDADGAMDCADTDCQGLADGPCATGQPGVCAPGTYKCLDLSKQCVANQIPQPEICTDGLDNDCDGFVDSADPDCQVAREENCFDDVDNDGDLLVDCVDPDCAGARDGLCDTGLLGVCAAGTFVCSGTAEACQQNVQPRPELCGDALDNDCDGLVDGADPDCQMVAADVWLTNLRGPNYVMTDKDGFARRRIVVDGQGDMEIQLATVTLVATPINAVTVHVTPASITLPVIPGDDKTRFRFSATFQCNQPGEWNVIWTSVITATENRDPANDTRTDTTVVVCKKRGKHDSKPPRPHDDPRNEEGHGRD